MSKKQKHKKKKQPHRSPLEELYHLVDIRDKEVLDELLEMQHPLAFILQSNPKFKLTDKQKWWMVYCIRDGYKPLDDTIQPNYEF